MKRFVLRLLCLPSDVIAMLIAGFIRIAWGGESEWKAGVWWVRLRADSWPARTWYEPWGATTFGHAVMVSAKAHNWTSAGLRGHELVHVEQYEIEAIQGAATFAAFASLGWWWAGLIWWSMAGLMGMAAGFATAWLRGEDPYSGSANEEGARGRGR